MRCTLYFLFRICMISTDIIDKRMMVNTIFVPQSKSPSHMAGSSCRNTFLTNLMPPGSKYRHESDRDSVNIFQFFVERFVNTIYDALNRGVDSGSVFGIGDRNRKILAIWQSTEIIVITIPHQHRH